MRQSLRRWTCPEEIHRLSPEYRRCRKVFCLFSASIYVVNGIPAGNNGHMDIDRVKRFHIGIGHRQGSATRVEAFAAALNRDGQGYLVNRAKPVGRPLDLDSTGCEDRK